MSDNSRSVPLVVDLDGTLLKVDSLWEGLFYMIGKNPFLFCLLPYWILRGRLFFKRMLLPYCLECCSLLPMRTGVLEEIRSAKQQGRHVFLATAASTPLAKKIVEPLGLFTEVYGSSDVVNLKGSAKASFLEKRFGKNNFDYIGDSKADIPVWRISRQAVLAVADKKIMKILPTITSNWRSISGEFTSPTVKNYFKAARLHQWVKNILIFVPLIMSHSFNVNSVVTAFIAFISFGCCASSVYFINDLLDIYSDRLHPVKKNRPFASGDIPLAQAPYMVAGALALSMGLCLLLPLNFALALLGYYCLTFSYSLFLKKQLMADVIMLACLYLIRVICGAAALGLTISNWLMAFCIFIFLGLALLKRTSEVILMSNSKRTCLYGRAYTVSDKYILETMAICSGFCGIVIFVLYIDSLLASTLYSNPQLLWVLFPLFLFWYGRMSILANRGEIHDDPVKFILSDKVSIFICIVSLLIIVLAI